MSFRWWDWVQNRLPAAATLATSNRLPVVQTNASKRTTLGELFTLLPAFTPAGTGAVPRPVQDKERDTVSFKDWGAVANATGVTGVGTDSTAYIQSAMTYCAANGLTLRGTSGIYRITTQLNASSNLKMVMDEDCVIFFDNTTSTSGWITHTNYSVGETLSKVTIRGGELRGLTDWSSGANAIRINCDDLVIDNLLIRYFGKNGMGMLLSGNRGRVSNARLLNPYIAANGYDGIHFFAGSDWIFSDCHVESDDDCYAVVTGADAVPFGNQNISNVHFVNCTYVCNRARGFVVTTDGTTASISNVTFTGGGGPAPVDASATASGMEVANSASGTVSGVTVTASHVDNSTSGTTAGALRVANTGSGATEDISFLGVRVLSPNLEALFITTGAGSVLPKNIRFTDSTFGAPRGANRCVSIKEGQSISFDGCRFTGCVTKNNNVIGVGTGAVDCPDVHFSRCLFNEIGDTSAIRYGIAWVLCSLGSSRSNAFVPAAGTTASRSHNIGASASNLTIDGDDLSQVTAPAKFANSGTAITMRGCKGAVTNASGTGTITNGNTSVNITHGLATSITPTVQQVTITPSATTTNKPRATFVDTLGGTVFKVNSDADPGASGLAFGWTANCEKLS